MSSTTGTVPGAGRTGAGAHRFNVSGATDVLAEALAAHRAGQLDAAAALYGEVLEAAPNNPDALHLLGVLRHQEGDGEAAVELIGRAIELDDKRAMYHANRATALQKLGRVDDAVEGYRRALGIDPVNAEANANLGHLLKDLGRADEAIGCYESSLRFEPRVRSVHKHLASLYLDQGRAEEASDLYRQFLDVAPDDAEANANYGSALEQRDELDRALVHYQKAQTLAPRSVEICSNLASLLKRLKRYADAQHYLDIAASLAPDNVQILHNRKALLLEQEKYAEAAVVIQRLIELEPENAGNYQDLGTCYGSTGRSEEALRAFLKADALDPNNAVHLANLGTTLANMSRHAEAVEVFRAAIGAAEQGSAALHASLCISLQRSYRGDEANLQAHVAMELPGWEPRLVPAVASAFRATCDFDGLASLGDQIAACEHHVKPKNLMGAFLDLRPLTETLELDRRLTALHVRWGDAMLEQAAMSPLPERKRPAGGAKVRLGFLSSDLRSHVVAKFVKALFDRYDRDRFELYAYTQFDLPSDPMQVDLKRKSTFRLTGQLPDNEVAALIRSDQVDVLFELNAATQHSQLAALAWRPAPVQVSWLGYGGTTGLRTVDYALVDRFVKPTEPDLWVEKFLEMHGAWVCFSDYPEIPIADELPLQRNGFVTFGTMNAAYKQTPAMIALWARILHAVPGSRMLFVRPEVASLIARVNIAKEFGKHDIAAERLVFIANTSSQYNHLEYFNEIDIALDTYPAVGGTTSCDTMWMGVPIVGRFGPNMHQRLNHALVNHCGLGELSVESDEAYFDLAVSLAGDVERLQALRAGLRNRVKGSAMYDAAGFARDFQDRVEEVVARHGLR
jgi:protein O-GlcNAc transferase